MWNVLKFTYSRAGESQVHTNVQGYLHLDEAEEMFDYLRLAYQFGVPLRVKGGERITILSLRLYTSFREVQHEAEAEVRSGGARLIQEAHEIEIDLDEQAS